MLPIVSVGKRQELPGRIASHRAGSDAAADPACDRHPDRRRRLGAAAAGTGALVGRHTRHRERPGHRRRGRRRADCRRREVRQTRLVVPDEPDLEGVADDLHVRRAAAHRRRGGRQHPRSRSATDLASVPPVRHAGSPYNLGGYGAARQMRKRGSISNPIDGQTSAVCSPPRRRLTGPPGRLTSTQRANTIQHCARPSSRCLAHTTTPDRLVTGLHSHPPPSNDCHPTASWVRSGSSLFSARAGWARSIAPTTRNSSVPSRSKYCPTPSRRIRIVSPASRRRLVRLPR